MTGGSVFLALLSVAFSGPVSGELRALVREHEPMHVHNAEWYFEGVDQRISRGDLRLAELQRISAGGGYEAGLALALVGKTGEPQALQLLTTAPRLLVGDSGRRDAAAWGMRWLAEDDPRSLLHWVKDEEPSERAMGAILALASVCDRAIAKLLPKHLESGMYPHGFGEFHLMGDLERCKSPAFAKPLAEHLERSTSPGAALRALDASKHKVANEQLLALLKPFHEELGREVGPRLTAADGPGVARLVQEAQEERHQFWLMIRWVASLETEVFTTELVEALVHRNEDGIAHDQIVYALAKASTPDALEALRRWRDAGSYQALRELLRMERDPGAGFVQAFTQGTPAVQASAQMLIRIDSHESLHKYVSGDQRAEMAWAWLPRVGQAQDDPKETGRELKILFSLLQPRVLWDGATRSAELDQAVRAALAGLPSDLEGFPASMKQAIEGILDGT